MGNANDQKAHEESHAHGDDHSHGGGPDPYLVLPSAQKEESSPGFLLIALSFLLIILCIVLVVKFAA